MPSGSFWKGKRVWLSGHTGFKGSWLSLWLGEMGAIVAGFSLEPPTTPTLFVEARIADRVASTIGDVRDAAAVLRAMADARPDIVIHMAAQSLVRQSYADPVGTFATNVMGTVHVLDAVRQVGTVRAVVVVTTDKCYENREWVWAYREDEAMGGYDPYSASKGCAELAVAAFRRSFAHGNVAIASARAGNVIGGGDWAADRLVPDTLRAFAKRQDVLIRNPAAVRPWQHVLEPLAGYLVLAERLWAGGAAYAEAWNFGPREDDARPVGWIVSELARHWGDDAGWVQDVADAPHEALLLKLDISKARALLDWQPRWSLGTALEHIVAWQRAWLAGNDVAQLSVAQIGAYTETSRIAS